MRFIPYFIYLLLIGMHQVIWKDLTSIYGITINLTALLVLMVALYKTEVISIWFGFAAGLVLASGAPKFMGWHALILAFIGLTGFSIRERLNLESLYTRLLFVFVGILLHNIILMVIQADEYFYQLWFNAVFGAVYTVFIAWLFFLVKDGIITFKKIKSFF
ncbi:MAG: hypothetical protein ACOYVF_05205 [Candidatus Zixiibacteriota bacterium]